MRSPPLERIRRSSVAPIEYAGPASGTCPICFERPVTPGKSLYGYAVCKKDLYKFANRRQIAYLVDAVLFTIVSGAAGYGLGTAMFQAGAGAAMIQVAAIGLGLVFGTLFACKDGIGGQSPGKRLTDVQVVDAISGEPATIGQSFKRNWWFLLGAIPVVGGFIQLALVIVAVIQMTKGPRFGDRFAHTRVLWKKHIDSPVFGGGGNRCRQCGYDLTGNESGQCPECGAPVAPVAVAMPVA